MAEIRTIWKYSLAQKSVGAFEIEMPRGAELLTVQMQTGEACLWARVNPDAPMEMRRLAIVGTGHAAPLDGTYVDTFQMFNGSLVWHLFADTPEEDDD